jgi:hypothetical protein
MKNSLFFILSLLLASTILPACVPTTTDIDASWRDSSFKGGAFKNVLVIVLANDPLKKRSAESTICEMIKEKGAKAATGYDVFPSSLLLNKKTLRPIVEQYGFDAIFLAEVLGREQAQKEVAPATTSSTTINNTGGSSLFAGNSVTRTITYSSPATVINYENVYIDNKLYDVKSEKEVWHLQTKTVNPQNFDKSLKQVTRTIVNDLSQGKFL